MAESSALPVRLGGRDRGMVSTQWTLSGDLREAASVLPHQRRAERRPVLDPLPGGLANRRSAMRGVYLDPGAPAGEKTAKDLTAAQQGHRGSREPDTRSLRSFFVQRACAPSWGAAGSVIQ